MTIKSETIHTVTCDRCKLTEVLDNPHELPGAWQRLLELTQAGTVQALGTVGDHLCPGCAMGWRTYMGTTGAPLTYSVQQAQQQGVLEGLGEVEVHLRQVRDHVSGTGYDMASGLLTWVMARKAAHGADEIDHYTADEDSTPHAILEEFTTWATSVIQGLPDAGDKNSYYAGYRQGLNVVLEHIRQQRERARG